jgi:hypothetical protein
VSVWSRGTTRLRLTDLTSENHMRYLKLPLTVVLGVLVGLDAVIGFRVWRYGLPHRLVLRQAAPGAEGVLLQRVPFVVQDWIVLGVLTALHLGLVYLVRRSWRATRPQ